MLRLGVVKNEVFHILLHPVFLKLAVATYSIEWSLLRNFILIGIKPPTLIEITSITLTYISLQHIFAMHTRSETAHLASLAVNSTIFINIIARDDFVNLTTISFASFL